MQKIIVPLNAVSLPEASGSIPEDVEMVVVCRNDDTATIEQLKLLSGKKYTIETVPGANSMFYYGMTVGKSLASGEHVTLVTTEDIKAEGLCCTATLGEAVSRPAAPTKTEAPAKQKKQRTSKKKKQNAQDGTAAEHNAEDGPVTSDNQLASAMNPPETADTSNVVTAASETGQDVNNEALGFSTDDEFTSLFEGEPGSDIDITEDNTDSIFGAPAESMDTSIFDGTNADISSMFPAPDPGPEFMNDGQNAADGPEESLKKILAECGFKEMSNDLFKKLVWALQTVSSPVAYDTRLGMAMGHGSEEAGEIYMATKQRFKEMKLLAAELPKLQYADLNRG